MKNIKTILIAVLSFMLLFSVSCKNEDKTGGGSGGSVDVPTATGDPATDLTATATYSGTVNRTASEGNAAEFTETMEFVLGLSNNQILAAGMFGGLSSKQILKSGSEYSTNGEMSEGEVSVKEYIKFTVSTDGNSVELLEYTAGGSVAGESFKVTYSGGTLTKQ